MHRQEWFTASGRSAQANAVCGLALDGNGATETASDGSGTVANKPSGAERIRGPCADGLLAVACSLLVMAVLIVPENSTHGIPIRSGSHLLRLQI